MFSKKGNEMTDAEKVAKLLKCIELLNEVDVIQQKVLGTESWALHNTIYGVITEMEEEIDALYW